MRVTTLLAVMVLGTLTPQVSGAQQIPVVPPNAVVFRNALPGSYRLVRVRLLIDGIAKLDQTAPFFNYRLPPGDHAIDVQASYRLDDQFFTYMRDYAIELHSMNIVRAGGRPVTLLAIARERGSATTPMTKRAVIHWQVMR